MMRAMLQQQQPGASGQPGGQPPTAGGEGGPSANGAQPPRAAPMSTPQEKKGLKAAAQTNIHIAVNMLEEALPAFGAESSEGQAILDILKKLGRLFGKRDSGDLVPAELAHMVSRMPQMGGGTDLQKMIRQQMMQPQNRQPQGAQ